jgi:hypothetical protein
LQLPVETVINNPANAGLRRYFEPRFQQKGVSCLASPEDVSHPYYTLGTHPDLVARLWDELGNILPADCRAAFFGNPALIHPETGIVFGFAGGTHTYSLRLPAAQRLQATGIGAKRVKHYPGQPSFDLDQIGEEWVFCGWFKDEEAWCRAAYEYASSV